jgi:hypothetical protein
MPLRHSFTLPQMIVQTLPAAQPPSQIPGQLAFTQ